MDSRENTPFAMLRDVPPGDQQAVTRSPLRLTLNWKKRARGLGGSASRAWRTAAASSRRSAHQQEEAAAAGPQQFRPVDVRPDPRQQPLDRRIARLGIKLLVELPGGVDETAEGGHIAAGGGDGRLRRQAANSRKARIAARSRSR